MPVNTIASPAASAASITSASRTEPPGWITARAPAATISSSPSANGKNASDATTLAPSSPASAILRAAILELSSRFIWPAPMPTVAPSRA